MSTYNEISTSAHRGSVYTGGEAEAVIRVEYHSGKRDDALRALNEAYAEVRGLIERTP